MKTNISAIFYAKIVFYIILFYSYSKTNSLNIIWKYL